MGYWQDVEGIAQDAVDTYPLGDDYDDSRNDYIHESVDGSSNIIYYSENEEVLLQTKNEPDGSEVQAMAGAGADWRQMRTVAAYLAMEADVHEAVAQLIEERKEAEVIS